MFDPEIWISIVTISILSIGLSHPQIKDKHVESRANQSWFWSGWTEIFSVNCVDDLIFPVVLTLPVSVNTTPPWSPLVLTWKAQKLQCVHTPCDRKPWRHHRGNTQLQTQACGRLQGPQATALSSSSSSSPHCPQVNSSLITEQQRLLPRLPTLPRVFTSHVGLQDGLNIMWFRRCLLMDLWKASYCCCRFHSGRWTTNSPG